MPTRKSKTSVNLEGSRFWQLGRIPFLPIRKSSFLHIQKGLIFGQPQGLYFFNPGGVSILPTRRCPIFANPEGSCFCQQGRFQSGRVSFLSTREDINPDNHFANPEGSPNANPEGSPNANPEGSEFCERKCRDPKYTKTRHLLEINLIKRNIHCAGIT